MLASVLKRILGFCRQVSSPLPGLDQVRSDATSYVSKYSAGLLFRYFFATACIVAFLIGSYGINLSASSSSKLYEQAINISGKQRMLSQRALYLASEKRRGVVGAAESLGTVIEEFSAANESLAYGVIEGSEIVLSDSLRAHYWSTTDSLGLYQHSAELVNAVQGFLSTESENESLWLTVNSFGESSLLGELDQAVSMFEAEALRLTQRAVSVQFISLAAGIIAVCLMWLLIFNPSRLLLKNTIKDLQNLNASLKNQERLALKHAASARVASLKAQQDRDKALASERVKSEFLATMSHEIRTPLNGVLGMLELLSMDLADKDNLTKVEVARSSAKGLLRIINDILIYSRLEDNSLPLYPSTFDAHQLIHEAIELFRPLALKKNLVLSCSIETSFPQWVSIDRERVAQVLNNLISNAIKFTEVGEVNVVCSGYNKEDTSVLCIEIVDSGIGISEVELGEVFEKFTQAKSVVANKLGGSGLGLAISRKIIELLEGEITCDSIEGKGSRFRISVPVSNALAQPPAEAKAIAVPAKRVLNILVAEDNPTNQLLIKSMIKKLGHQVTLAENGQGAIMALDSTAFDIVLMDIQMPIMDGLEATAKIRSRADDKKNVPIFAVTANTDTILNGDSSRVGLNGYLPKPISIFGLQKLFDRVLE